MNRNSSFVNWLNLNFGMAPGRLAAYWVGMLVGLCGLGCEPAAGEEPYERFLQKLRDEQLFDLALVYLNDLQAKPTVSGEFKANIELERGLLLYQSAAILPPSKPERPRQLDDAEAALRSFLDVRLQHPRRGEARMKLGELLLTRAEEAKLRAAAEPNADNQEAIKFYDQAHQLFEATIQELAGILEGIKGARTDVADTAAVAYRQKLQKDIRQSQLLSAKSVEDRGRSRAANSPERTKDLEQALKMFSDLYSKELGLVAVRNYALFYRSGIHVSLGKVEDAIDGYQRIADVAGVDFLRPLQSSAIKELINLLGQQKKFTVAVDRAEKWLANLRPDERNMPETLALKLELAKQKLAWAEDLKVKNTEDRVAGRLIRDTRNELRMVMRTPGPHLEEARELLGKLGVEEQPAATQELPSVKNFGEALAAAQERIERSETASLGLESINLELVNGQTSAERKQELQDQLRATQAAIDIDQQQALQLLQTGLRLYKPSDAREQLYDARFRMAFLLLKQQRPWEAMAVAEFLSRTAAGTETGLRAAAITLGSFSDLLRGAGPEAKQELTGQLEPFAEYLVATWPQSSEASAAAAALVQLALINKDFQQAEQFLSMLPTEGQATSKLRRDAGLSFYAKYLEEKNSAGEQAETTLRLRTQALQLLQSGVTGLTAETLDASGIDAINLVSRMLIADGQVDQAVALFLESASSPLKAVEKNPTAFPARVVMETYRTTIQLKMALLNDDRLPADQAVTQIRDTITQLQEAASDPASQETLTVIFVSLARDLKEQLGSTQDANQRKKMSETLILVASEAAKANNFNTEYWAADTIVSIAQELEKTSGGNPQAVAAYNAAAKILEAILAKEKNQPGWINPPGLVTQLRLKLAQTSRGLGDYKNAIEQLATILEKNSGVLDVQMEAAWTYQAWGDKVNSGFHKVAIEGGRPDPKTRIKLIWGWGKIQQMTANQPKFSEQFFEARYQLAYSRMRYARGLSDPQLKSDELKRAEHDIESTAKLFPDLGGPVMKKRFQSLLKSIQQAD
jgi:hypothetical protein